MATQRLLPNALTTQTSLTGSIGNVNNGVDATDGVNLVATANNVDITAVVSFPTPIQALDSGTHTASALVSQFDAGQTGIPTVSIEVLDGATLISSTTGVSVSSVDQLITTTFTTANLVTADGSGLSVRVIGVAAGGKPAKRNTVNVGEIDIVTSYTIPVANPNEILLHRCGI